MTMDFIDMSNVSSVWDITNMAKNFNFDIVEFAKENVGIFMSVSPSTDEGCFTMFTSVIMHGHC